ncbi:MAG TPA: hypothetical protein VFV34_14995 [Blastocatellia bacterium]|nr:hypothetical protein [Blastocatellia bacterium]
MRYDNEQMAQSPASGSVRLILEYDGDEIRLVSRQEVDMEPPLSDPTTAPAEQAGFWLEVRDSKLQVLHRQVMHDPAMTHPEVFSNEPGKSIVRSSKPVAKGAFTVIVPAVPDSDHVAFIRKGPGTQAKAAPGITTATGEVARIPLKSEPAAESKPKKKQTQKRSGKKNSRGRRK